MPQGMEEGSSFGPGIIAAALYLRYIHPIGYRRLCRLFAHLFAASPGEGALHAMSSLAKSLFDREVGAFLARLRRSRVICSDETRGWIDGRTYWKWVFQNDLVLIYVVRNSRAAAVVPEALEGHRPAIRRSDLYAAQEGWADAWQVCLAHQLSDCQFAIEAGNPLFAPRMKRILLRAALLARRRHNLAASTASGYRRRLDGALDAIMPLTPENRQGKRLRKRYAKVRGHHLTFLDYPEAAPDNNSFERELRPTPTYRKVTGGFRSSWGADLFAGIKPVIGTAARQGMDAYHATIEGIPILKPS